MEKSFKLPIDLIGKFAVVKLWPEIKTAEDECIARLKITASFLGLECIEINPDGLIIGQVGNYIDKTKVDFVIHLHYDTPKNYDAFSFVALWNPLQFYHQWGYCRTSRNLLTHDDFISCSSIGADDHIKRLIRNSNTHLPPKFHLYHSTDYIVHSPTLGDYKLFYAGINWDILNGGISRHQTLLKKLDQTGDLRIFGPKIFQGVDVWRDYKSYVKEIPFDGISMIHEISKAGIALVLSSQAHKDSELMSNRLFESIAAGALVICDENNFAKKFFGDTLLYIDSRDPIEKIYNDINQHIQFAKKNPHLAIKMIQAAQDIFEKKFSLRASLSELYINLSERKRSLSLQSNTPLNSSVMVFFLLPKFSEVTLEAYVSDINSQDYIDFQPVLILDKENLIKNNDHLRKIIKKSKIPIRLLEVDIFESSINDSQIKHKKTGEIFLKALSLAKQKNAFMFIAPNERIFSNHIQVLVKNLNNSPGSSVVASAIILRSSSAPVNKVHDRVDFTCLKKFEPNGFARFLIQSSVIPDDLDIALPYLNRKMMAVLISCGKVVQIPLATVAIDTDIEFPSRNWDEGQENELLSTFCPQVFQVLKGHEIFLPDLNPPSNLINSKSRINNLTSLLNNFLSTRWIAFQIKQIKYYGLNARLKTLKARLESAIR